MNRNLVYVALLLCSCPFASAQATVILSNLPGTGTYNTAAVLSTTVWAAVGFTTGPTAETLGSVQGMFGNGAVTAVTLEGGIYSNVANHPDTLLSAFTNVTIPANTATPIPVSVSTASSFTMQPSTEYWLVFRDPPAAGLNWAKDNNGFGTVPTASAGHTYDGVMLSANSGSTWSTSGFNNTIEVNATPAPEPGTFVLGSLGAGALLAIARRRQAGRAGSRRIDGAETEDSPDFCRA